MKTTIRLLLIGAASLSASCDLLTLPPSETKVSTITIDGAVELEEGESTLLSLDVQPADADDKSVIWSSDDEAVAAVDSNGRVTGKSAGNAVITAEAADGSGVADDFAITVTEAAIPVPTGAIVADHSVMRRIYDGLVPVSAIENAKAMLKIGYGHTSHGSQIVSGMDGLVDFVNGSNESGERFASGENVYYDDLFSWSHDGAGGDLLLFEGSGYSSGDLELDCGYSGWDTETREFLDANPEYNVIMWSWCGQVNDVDLQTHYFDAMESLEADYPDVSFVYMTGHLEGGSDNPETNTLLAANNAIRDYCTENGKILFDFADIEKYDLDGEYFGDRNVDDACDYDGGNWAIEWQNAHTEGVDWYNCGAVHSQPLSANQKAYAVWWLWARLAGWEG